VDMPSFPTEFENGVVLDHAWSRITVEPVELPEDRDYDVVEETMKQLQPERN